MKTSKVSQIHDDFWQRSATWVSSPCTKEPSNDRQRSYRTRVTRLWWSKSNSKYITISGYHRKSLYAPLRHKMLDILISLYHILLPPLRSTTLLYSVAIHQWKHLFHLTIWSWVKKWRSKCTKTFEGWGSPNNHKYELTIDRNSFHYWQKPLRDTA